MLCIFLVKLDSYLPPIEYTVIFITKLFYCIIELDKNSEISLRRRDQVFKIHEEDGVTFELQMTIVNVPRIVFGNLNIFKLQILVLLCCETFQITFNIFLFSITLNGKDNYCRLMKRHGKALSKTIDTQRCIGKKIQ